ncbi:alpha/beta hydrolase [Pseudomonas citronellolis]|uniref:alpha/beta hydrolase n=1 Tax=Pseudomonas citronellolis TaxID=53408 RepID=UPI0021BF353F|nr:lysophospholipase [Pseudomonas citronellolis]UXJ50216.1 lysophospholipase [Pseudomonas citronellolis]
MELRIDVSEVVPYHSPQRVALTVYLPSAEALGAQPVAIFASPGGGYTRHYYDMDFPGHADYSQALTHVRNGFIFVSYDHLGVGDSSSDHLREYTVHQLAAANDAAVREVLRRLRQGELRAGYPALPHLKSVGLGQSMGGCITINMQGRHSTFDGIAPLGYSALHTVLPQRSEEDRLRGMQGHLMHGQRPLEEISVEASSETVVDFVYPFHWEDVPPDILAADMDGGYPMRRTAPRFGSLTVPPCAVTMMTPGVVKAEAAAIKVPVLVAMGARDVCPEPHREPTAYPGSNDVSLFIVPHMAHMHNFAGTRRQLWSYIESWARRVCAP